MAEMSDYRAFGDLLHRTQFLSGKKYAELRKELRYNVSLWHEGAQLPSVERLPEIARVYGVNPEALRAAFDTAKEARDLELAAIKRSKRLPRPKPSQSESYGF